MIFSDIQNIIIPEGEVAEIRSGSNLLWQKDAGETYTFLNYIEGTGTQYIDTELLHTSLDEVYELDIQIMPRSNNNLIFSNSNDVAINLYIQGTNRGSINAKYGKTSYSQKANINPTSYISRAVWRLQNGSLYRGNTSVMSLTRSTAIPTQTDTIKLLAYDGSYYTCGELYGFKVTDNSSGDTIMDLVPAMRDSDGEIGMYDQMNDVFYTNSGTGTFNYG